jgi:hypothetical protein
MQITTSVIAPQTIAHDKPKHQEESTPAPSTPKGAARSFYPDTIRISARVVYSSVVPRTRGNSWVRHPPYRSTALRHLF